MDDSSSLHSTASSYTMDSSLHSTTSMDISSSSDKSRRVSFNDSISVFDVEKLDASLTHDLFYSPEDYQRFRCEQTEATTALRREKLAASRQRQQKPRRLTQRGAGGGSGGLQSMRRGASAGTRVPV